MSCYLFIVVYLFVSVLRFTNWQEGIFKETSEPENKGEDFLMSCNKDVNQYHVIPSVCDAHNMFASVKYSISFYMEKRTIFILYLCWPYFLFDVGHENKLKLRKYYETFENM